VCNYPIYFEKILNKDKFGGFKMLIYHIAPYGCVLYWMFLVVFYMAGRFIVEKFLKGYDWF